MVIVWFPSINGLILIRKEYNISKCFSLKVFKHILKLLLENNKLDLEVVEEGLLIKPILNTRRKNWKSNIESILSKNKDKKDEAVISELLDDSDLEDFKW